MRFLAKVENQKERKLKSLCADIKGEKTCLTSSENFVRKDE